jgi:hypothetical protein
MFRCTLVVAWAALALPLSATTIARATLDELIEKSTSIVRGKVLRVYGVRNGGLVSTYVRVGVIERLKGPEAAEVEVVIPGGTAGGLVQKVSGVPQLVEGAEHVLFLWRGRSGQTRLLGLGQGVLDLGKGPAGEPVVTRQAIDAHIVDPASGRAVEPEVVSLRYADFAARVKRVLASTARTEAK